MESNAEISYVYPLEVYDEETDSYGYYTEEDTAEEGWKFNKFNPYPSNTLLLVRFTDAQAAPIKAEWETQKTQITGVINRVIVLIVVALALFVYLLFATGRRPEDEEVHFATIDRLPVEVNVVLFWSVLGTAAGLNIALMSELLSGSGDLSFLLLPSILFFVAAFAFALELTLSLVRLLKAGSLARRSWCIRAFRWCFNKIGVLCTGTWHAPAGCASPSRRPFSAITRRGTSCCSLRLIRSFLPSSRLRSQEWAARFCVRARRRMVPRGRLFPYQTHRRL